MVPVEPPPPRATGHVSTDRPSASAAPAPSGATGRSEEHAIASAEQWPFLDHVVESCVADALTGTSYLVEWFQHAGAERSGPPGGPRPLSEVRLPVHGPRAGSPGYREARSELVSAWGTPQRQSHVMDCTVRVPPEQHPEGEGARRVPYTIYLPADYLEDPLRTRPILVLASGGGGDRTRWFLPPLETNGIEPGTGGLEMRARMDAWAALHPAQPTPLVIALDCSSGAYTNGMLAFIDHELPDHLLATYLPHQTRAQTPYGIEAVSSGAVVTLRALRANPGLFASVGLSSLYCGGDGFDPRRDFGSTPERSALFAGLAERRARGLFDVRFSMGALDRYWDCTYRLFHDLSAAGVLPLDAGPPQAQCARTLWPPASPDAASPPVAYHCAGRWPAFESWPSTGHHYRALAAALPSALEWNLTALARVLAQGPEHTGTSAPSALP